MSFYLMKESIIRIFLTALVAIFVSAASLSAQDDFQKGVQAYNNDDYSTALKYFLKYENRNAWRNCALCYYYLNDYDNAIKMALKSDVNDPYMLGIIADSFRFRAWENNSDIGLTECLWNTIAWFRGSPDFGDPAADCLSNYTFSDGTHSESYLNTAYNIALLSLKETPDDLYLNFRLGSLFALYLNPEDSGNQDNAKYWFKRFLSLAEREGKSSERFEMMKAIVQGLVDGRLNDASESRATVRLDNLSQFTAVIPRFTCNGSRILTMKQDSEFMNDCIIIQADANVSGAEGKRFSVYVQMFDEDGKWVAGNIDKVFGINYIPKYDNTHYEIVHDGIYTSDMYSVSEGRTKVYIVMEIYCDGAIIGYSDIREAYVNISNGKILSFTPVGGEIRGNY